jgi:hypothetical protein
VFGIWDATTNENSDAAYPKVWQSQQPQKFELTLCFHRVTVTVNLEHLLSGCNSSDATAMARNWMSQGQMLLTIGSLMSDSVTKRPEMTLV